jgi:hypothetical protein
MKKIYVLFLIFVALQNITLFAQKLEVPIDPKAVKLLNDLMNALSITDFDESAKAVAKLSHKSILNDGELTKDVYSFSFKKAHQNAKFYKNPVSITRTRLRKTTPVGYQETAEEGKTIDYFIDKKEKKNGMPAPIQIFFPANGGEPKILYVGNL